MKKYNIVGFYPKYNDWCLILLGNDNKEMMEKKLEEIKANPKEYRVNLEDVTEIKLEEINKEENGKAWWNEGLD